MDIKTWLEAEKGRLTVIAAHFGVTAAAVTQWKTNGVPRANMKEIREMSGGLVSLDDMIPDRAESRTAA